MDYSLNTLVPRHDLDIHKQLSFSWRGYLPKSPAHIEIEVSIRSSPFNINMHTYL